MKLIYLLPLALAGCATTQSRDAPPSWPDWLPPPYFGPQHPEAPYERCSEADGAKRYKCDFVPAEGPQERVSTRSEPPDDNGGYDKPDRDKPGKGKGKAKGHDKGKAKGKAKGHYK